MDYLEEQDDTVRRNEPYLRSGGNRALMEIVGKWAGKYAEVLNVGCGGYMPLLVHTTQAMDVVPVTGELLKKNGWDGPFMLGSVTDMLFANHAFEAGICCEVVEHLEHDEEVLKAFKEMDRVCRAWLITTPCVKTGEPTHRRVLLEEDVQAMCGKYGANYWKFSLWWFIWKGQDARAGCLAGCPRGAWHG